MCTSWQSKLNHAFEVHKNSFIHWLKWRFLRWFLRTIFKWSPIDSEAISVHLITVLCHISLTQLNAIKTYSSPMHQPALGILWRRMLSPVMENHCHCFQFQTKWSNGPMESWNSKTPRGQSWLQSLVSKWLNPPLCHHRVKTLKWTWAWECSAWKCQCSFLLLATMTAHKIKLEWPTACYVHKNATLHSNIFYWVCLATKPNDANGALKAKVVTMSHPMPLSLQQPNGSSRSPSLQTPKKSQEGCRNFWNDTLTHACTHVQMEGQIRHHVRDSGPRVLVWIILHHKRHGIGGLFTACLGLPSNELTFALFIFTAHLSHWLEFSVRMLDSMPTCRPSVGVSELVAWQCFFPQNCTQ